jgi:hypothetical protein
MHHTSDDGMSMTKEHQFIFALFASILISTSSCVTLGAAGIDDLKLISIQVIEKKNAPKSAWPRSLDSELFLDILLQTKVDLTDYANDYDYNVSNVIAACKSRSIDRQLALQGDTRVFDNLGPVTRETGNQIKRKKDRQAPLSYHIYVRMKSVKLASEPNAFRYNLLDQALNICVQIFGGRMVGGRFESNVVYISSKNVIYAINASDLSPANSSRFE